MPTWKRNIFVRVVTRRMQEEGRTAEDVLEEYPELKPETELEQRIADLEDAIASILGGVV